MNMKHIIAASILALAAFGGAPAFADEGDPLVEIVEGVVNDVLDRAKQTTQETDCDGAASGTIRTHDDGAQLCLDGTWHNI